MTASRIIFVDYPEVDPCKQDNSICVQTCPIRGRYRDDRCPYFGRSTLRDAILCGYTRKKDEAEYPSKWLDKWTIICYAGHAFVHLNSAEEETRRALSPLHSPPQL